VKNFLRHGRRPRTVSIVDVTRRPATNDDRAEALAIHHRAYRDVVERQFGHWDESAQDGYFGQAWTGHPHDILERAGRAIGFVAVEERARSVVIHELVVDPAFQGRGVGTHVLRSVIDDARRLGRRVELQVLHDNDGARRLYERVGFRACSSTPTHLHMRLD